MVTAAGLWEVNQNRQGLVHFNPIFFPSTRKSKMENAPDIKSKSFEKVLKNRLVLIDTVCHFQPAQSALRTPILTIKYQIYFN
jgi:hypothetical protein